MLRNPKHIAGYQPKNDHENTESGRPAYHAAAALRMIKTSCSIYVQMPTVIKTMTINNDIESNE
jgi:hypothetical protein